MPTNNLTSSNLTPGAASLGVPSFNPPVVISDYALDNGMTVFHNNCDRIYVCTGPITDFPSVISTALGSKNFGVGNAFGGINNGIPSGRVVTSIAFTDGFITNSGLAICWAAVDFANSHLLAWGVLSGDVIVNAGQLFGLPAFAIHEPAWFGGAGIAIICQPAISLASQAVGFSKPLLFKVLSANSLAASAASLDTPGIVVRSTFTAFNFAPIRSNSFGTPLLTVPSMTVTTSWSNQTLSPSQSGLFAFSFNAVPDTANDNAVIGLSQTAAAAYTDLSCLIRFSGTGTIDVFDGIAGGYTVTSFTFVAGGNYHFRFVGDVSTDLYSVYLTPPSQGETQIASNYGFRTPATSLGNLGGLAVVGTVSVQNILFTLGSRVLTAVNLTTGAAAFINPLIHVVGAPFVLAASNIASASAVVGTALLNGISSLLLVDTYPGAKVVLSLSKENSIYAGSCLGISRSTGASPTTIGFTGNALNLTTLNAYLAGGPAFIDTWFDQSGNGNNATQTTLANRWQIIVDTDGKPSATSNYVLSTLTAATSGMIIADNASFKTTVIDLYAVCKVGMTNSNSINYDQVIASWTAAGSAQGIARWGLVFSEGGFGDGLELPRNGAPNSHISASEPFYIPLGDGQRTYFHTYRYNSFQNLLQRNNVTIWNDASSVNVTYTGTGALCLGQDFSGSENSNGAFRAFVIYGTTQSSAISISSLLMSEWGTAEFPTSYNSGDGWLWTPQYDSTYTIDSATDINGIKWWHENGGYPDNGTRGPSVSMASNVSNGVSLVRNAVGPFDSDTIVTGAERCERGGQLSSGIEIIAGDNFERFAQIWIEPGPTPDGNWCLCFQNHYGSGNSPNIAYISLLGGQFQVITQKTVTGATADTNQGSPITYSRNTWYAIRLKAFWSTNGTSDTLQVWLGPNGSTLPQIVNASGALFTTDSTQAYIKQGIYRGYPGANTGVIAIRFANELFSKTSGAYASLVTTQPPLPTHT